MASSASMGLFRKLTSLTTVGLVDFRSDKERTAAYTRQAAGELRKQTKLLQAAQRQPPAPPPGDPNDLLFPGGGKALMDYVKKNRPSVPPGVLPAQFNGTVWQAWNAGANRWMIWDGQAWR